MMDTILWALLAFVGGVLFMAWLSRRERNEIIKNKDELIELARRDLNEAEDRADKAEKELIVKQNIIDSLSAKIQRQERTISKHKRMSKE